MSTKPKYQYNKGKKRYNSPERYAAERALNPLKDPRLNFQFLKASQGSHVSIAKHISPADYLKLILMHFEKHSEIGLQALGTSSATLTHLAFFTAEKGYATYEKILNDYIDVPYVENKNGEKKIIKRIRLNVTLNRSPDFFKIIENERKLYRTV